MSEISYSPSEETRRRDLLIIGAAFKTIVGELWRAREIPPGAIELRQQIPEDQVASLMRTLSLSCVGRLLLPPGTRFLDDTPHYGYIADDNGDMDVHTAKVGILNGLTVSLEPYEAYVEMCLDPDKPGEVSYAGFRLEYRSSAHVAGGPAQFGMQSIGIGIANDGLPALIRDVGFCGEQLLTKTCAEVASWEDVALVTKQVQDSL